MDRECQMCKGPLVYQGSLGNMGVYRCRNCGAEYMIPVTTDDERS